MSLANIKRPHFKRGQEWVVIRPTRVSSDTMLKPGDPLPPSIARFTHKQILWWKRNRISPKGHPYTNYMIKKYNKSKGKSDAKETKPQEKPFVPKDIKPIEEPTKTETKSQVEEVESKTESKVVIPEPVKLTASRWGFEDMPTAPKFTSKVKAQEWAEDNKELF